MGELRKFSQKLRSRKQKISKGKTTTVSGDEVKVLGSHC